MSESIKRGGGPGSSDDVATRPDVGFHDDHVGGHLKAEEAAKRRAALGVMQRRPKRIEVEPQQVGEVLRYRPTEDEAGEKEASRAQKGLVRGKGPPRAKPRKTDVALHAVDQDVRRIEDRVDLLMATLAKIELQRLADPGRPGPRPGEVDGKVLALVPDEGTVAEADASEEVAEVTRTHHRVEALGDEDAERRRQPPETPVDEAPLDEADAALRWDRTARDMRFLLQHLLAGGVGMVLSPDPAVTFKRIFDGLASWPERVPPGRKPTSEADYDQFLGWVFRPEFGDADLRELAEAGKDGAGIGRTPP